MTERLRVLVVTPDLPTPPTWGFAMRVHQLTLALARRHQVTLLSYARPDQQAGVATLRAACHDVVVVPRQPVSPARRRGQQARSLLSRQPFHASSLNGRAMQDALDACLRATPYDVVQVESSQMSTFRYRTDAALVLDEHNVESELLERLQQGESAPVRRLFNRAEAGKYRRLEQRAWSTATTCVTTSQRELEIIGRRRPGTSLAVVPNGVDPGYFAHGGRPAEQDSLVFTGLLGYRPNLDAVRHFLDEVLPRIRRQRPGVRLTVVGHGDAHDLQRLRAPGVTVTGQVPDIRPYLERAAVVVAPIRMGSGTRLKVVEALSMSRPVVSTRVGSEGIDVVDGRHLLLADSPDDFAAAVCRVLADRDLAGRLSAAGRDLAVERYSWQRSGDLLAEVHRAAAARVRGHRLAPV